MASDGTNFYHSGFGSVTNLALTLNSVLLEIHARPEPSIPGNKILRLEKNGLTGTGAGKQLKRNCSGNPPPFARPGTVAGGQPPSKQSLKQAPATTTSDTQTLTMPSDNALALFTVSCCGFFF